MGTGRSREDCQPGAVCACAGRALRGAWQSIARRTAVLRLEAGQASWLFLGMRCDKLAIECLGEKGRQRETAARQSNGHVQLHGAPGCNMRDRPAPTEFLGFIPLLIVLISCENVPDTQLADTTVNRTWLVPSAVCERAKGPHHYCGTSIISQDCILVVLVRRLHGTDAKLKPAVAPRGAEPCSRRNGWSPSTVTTGSCTGGDI